MLSTIPLLAAWRANSPGLQCDNGSPLSAGSSQASAMIQATCSALKRAERNAIGNRMPQASIEARDIGRIQCQKAAPIVPHQQPLAFECAASSALVRAAVRGEQLGHAR